MAGAWQRGKNSSEYIATTKEQIFEAILGKEGGYVDHPDDKGGPTRWGIIQAVARAHSYVGDMKELPRATALDILTADDWTGPHLDLVAELSPDIAAELCDTGVNVGLSGQSKWFQRWLNIFNQQSKIYPDLIADGQIGPRTISALKSFLTVRGKEGEQIMLKSLNCSQGQHYLELAEQRQANESFVYGWMKERVDYISVRQSLPSAARSRKSFSSRRLLPGQRNRG